MTRTLVLGVAVLACLASSGFGQTKTEVVQADMLCCGQTASEDETIAQLLLETQRNLQNILAQSTTARRLPAGDYYISMSPEGYEFRAWVSPEGLVDGWYVADLDGVPIALISNPGGLGDKISYCTAKLCRDLSSCANLSGRPNRYQLCINGAWDAFFSCLAGTSGGVVLR